MNSMESATLERPSLMTRENNYSELIQCWFHRFATKSTIKQFNKYIPDNATVKEWMQVMVPPHFFNGGTPYHAVVLVS